MSWLLPTSSGCPGSHPARLWAPAGLEHSQLSGQLLLFLQSDHQVHAQPWWFPVSSSWFLLLGDGELFSSQKDVLKNLLLKLRVLTVLFSRSIHTSWDHELNQSAVTTAQTAFSLKLFNELLCNGPRAQHSCRLEMPSAGMAHAIRLTKLQTEQEGDQLHPAGRRLSSTGTWEEHPSGHSPSYHQVSNAVS